MLAWVVLLVGAAWVRLAGVDCLLPQYQEPDTYLVDKLALVDAGPDVITRSKVLWSKYPHGLTELLSVCGAVLPSPRDAPRASLDEHLTFASSALVRARIVIAWLAWLAIPAIAWVVRRRGGGHGVAWLAAAFVATSLLHTSHAPQARPHAAFVTAALIAWIAADALQQRASVVRALLAGASAGLACATLQFGVFTLPVLAVAALVSRGPVPWRRRALHATIAFACAALAIVFAYATPSGFDSVSWWIGGHALDDKRWDIGNVHRLGQFLLDYDPTLAVLGTAAVLFSCFAWLRQRESASSPTSRSSRWLDITAVVPYVLVVGGIATTQQRFALALVPVLAAATALSVQALVTRFPTPVVRRALAVVLGVALIVSADLVVRLALIHREPDTLSNAAAWVREHATPRQDVIALEAGLDLPLFATRKAMKAQLESSWRGMSTWQQYQQVGWNAIDKDVAWHLTLIVPPDGAPSDERDGQTRRQWVRDDLAALSARYLIVRTSRPARRRPLLRIARSLGTTVARFPAEDADVNGAGFQDSGLGRRVRAGTPMGPPIEIIDLGAR